MQCFRQSMRVHFSINEFLALYDNVSHSNKIHYIVYYNGNVPISAISEILQRHDNSRCSADNMCDQ